MIRRIILSCICVLVGAATIKAETKVKNYSVKVVAEYPHSTSSYTQGLFWHNGTLYESTGLTGKSTMRTVDLKSGEAIRNLKFKKKYFVEGSCIMDDKLFILTWTNNVAFVYDAATLKYLKTYRYPREGWGLTTDGKQLIASDGSDKLYFMDSNFRTTKTVKVKINGRSVLYLNELEWIDGKIWANVYTTDSIMIINPDTGEVEGIVNCNGLLPQKYQYRDTDVLNGIAFNKETGKIYLTGKLWCRMYEIKLEER